MTALLHQIKWLPKPYPMFIIAVLVSGLVSLFSLGIFLPKMQTIVHQHNDNLNETVQKYQAGGSAWLNESLKYRKRCWNISYSNSQSPIDHTPGSFLPGSMSASDCRGDIFLLAYVQSAVAHRNRRNMIRSTWASVRNINGDRFMTVFFVGVAAAEKENAELRLEMDIHADMVQGDFLDTYRNLTLKHLYSLKWIAESCPSVKFILKVDDDSVLNIFNARQFLRKQVPAAETGAFYCHLKEDLVPSRGTPGPFNKWGVTQEEWPDSKYPVYCLGNTGYFITGNLAAPLLHCSNWRRYFWIEDVFITGSLAQSLGVPRIQWQGRWGYGGVFIYGRMSKPEEAGLNAIVSTEDNTFTPSLHQKVWRSIALRHWRDGV